MKDYKIKVSLSASLSTDDLLTCVKANGIILHCNYILLFILLVITWTYWYREETCLLQSTAIHNSLQNIYIHTITTIHSDCFIKRCSCWHIMVATCASALQVLYFRMLKYKRPWWSKQYYFFCRYGHFISDNYLSFRYYLFIFFFKKCAYKWCLQ